MHESKSPPFDGLTLGLIVAGVVVAIVVVIVVTIGIVYFKFNKNRVKSLTKSEKKRPRATVTKDMADVPTFKKRAPFPASDQLSQPTVNKIPPVDQMEYEDY
ncbi:hypothetical protein SNE40_000102 [Patella caerulea]